MMVVKIVVLLKHVHCSGYTHPKCQELDFILN